ncbi:MAG: ribosome silencing factor [Pseudomonadota bacterium]
MQATALCDLIVDTLTEHQAQDIQVLDVHKWHSLTDFFVVASGNSRRQVIACAEAVMQQAKQAGETILGHEGSDEGEWVLVDVNCVLVHIMQPPVRDYYQLEKLWSMPDQTKKSQIQGAFSMS